MKCEICGINDEEVLVKHHINSKDIIIVCANCHLKIHHRNFKDSKIERNIINLKKEIFNDNRLKEELFKLKERDYKVNKYLKTHYKFPN